MFLSFCLCLFHFSSCSSPLVCRVSYCLASSCSSSPSCLSFCLVFLLLLLKSHSVESNRWKVCWMSSCLWPWCCFLVWIFIWLVSWYCWAVLVGDVLVVLVRVGLHCLWFFLVALLGHFWFLLALLCCCFHVVTSSYLFFGMQECRSCLLHLFSLGACGCRWSWFCFFLKNSEC